MGARIHQINVSQGGVPKLPIASARVTTLGLTGDKQKHTKIHGGPERAVCLFSLEIIQRLQAEGHPIRPGSAGENVTITGLDWSLVKPGSRLRLGEQVLLEITRDTTPCKTITGSFRDGNFERILERTHPGESRFYARVIEEGEISTGDAVTLR